MKRHTIFLLFASFALSGQSLAGDLKFFPHSIPDFDPSAILALRDKTEFGNADLITRGSGARIFRKIAPTVVKVLTNEGHGTGIVISTKDNGIVLTNHHVIAGFPTVGLVFSDDSPETDVTLATVIKFDEIKDLALVRPNEGRPELRAISMSKVPPEIGDDVHAIGHPMGEDWTYTRGYISQLREDYSWQTSGIEHHVADVIQTQTPINPGNSGGPLVDDDGAMLGVNSFIQLESEGINFAVANSSVREFLDLPGNVERAVAWDAIDNEFLFSEDSNKNGNPDIYYWDQNANGTADLIGLDENEDQFIETLLVDENEDGNAEVVIYQKSYEGRMVTVYEFDENEDGKAESLGVDDDQDGEIDRLLPIS